MHTRRVVVTGLGAITPLGVGIKRTWSRLLAAKSGITSLPEDGSSEKWKGVTSRVAGLVPVTGDGAWKADEWHSPVEQRRLSKFTQYAMAVSEMALKDAEWTNLSPQDQEMTGVCFGSGIGNLEDMYDSSVAHHQGVSYGTNYVMVDLPSTNQN